MTTSGQTLLDILAGRATKAAESVAAVTSLDRPVGPEGGTVKLASLIRSSLLWRTATAVKTAQAASAADISGGPTLASDVQNPYHDSVTRMLAADGVEKPLTNEDYAAKFKRDQEAMSPSQQAAQTEAYWKSQPVVQRQSAQEIQNAAKANGWGNLPDFSDSRVLKMRDSAWNKAVDFARDSFIGDAWRGAKSLVKSVAPAHRAAQQPVQRDSRGRVIGAKPVQRRWTDDLADWMDTRGAYLRGLGSGYDPVKGMVGTGQVMLNGVAEGADYLLNRGARYLNYKNYGDSWEAKRNRKSLDNELENQKRTYEARHQHILDQMGVDEGMGRGMYSAPRLLGDVAGGEILTGGVGGGARLAGGAVRGLARGAGNAAARGLTRVGVSKNIATGVQNAMNGVGQIATTPLRPVEGLWGAGYVPASATQQVIRKGIPTMYNGFVQPMAQSASRIYNAARHPVQTARYAMKHPIDAAGTAFNTYFDADYNIGTPIRVAHDLATGDTSGAMRDAGGLAWYNSMRRINPKWLGMTSAIGVPAAVELMTGDNDEAYPEGEE